MTLAETQALFHRILTMPGDPPPDAQIDACFSGTAALPARERVAIYSGMYRARLVEALRETFPRLARHLGEEYFRSLGEDYLRRHPSEHHDIGQVGRHLPGFLRAYPDPDRPDLADLAELEWARQEVFFAPPAEGAGAEAFAGLDAEGFARAVPLLSPALRALALDHDVVPIWRRLEAGDEAGPAAPGPCAVAVWRAGFEVFHCLLAADEAEALRVAAAGGALTEICAAFTDRADCAAAAHAAIASWIGEGWIVGVETG